jgi:hypothetical protein
MTKPEATPRPWAVHQQWRDRVIPASDLGKRIGGSSDEDHDRAAYALVLARTTGEREFTKFAHRATKAEGEANAALIVRAVNSHDDLVEALHNMVALAAPHFSDAPQMLALSEARVALAKARGEP